MSAHAFYLYQISWFVFATMVGFLAALLLWKKGKYQAKGKILGIGMRLTGAGGIFVAVLLVFYLINPIKPLKMVYIVFSSEEISVLSTSETDEPFIINESEIRLGDRQFDQEKLSLELIPAQYIYELNPRLADNSFATREAIPQGIYSMRITFHPKGETKTYLVTVPKD